MEEKVPDRRKNHTFRFLYMDFKSFWERVILRKKTPSKPAPKPKAAPAPTRFLDQEKPAKPSATGVKKIDEQHHGIKEAILKLQKDLRDGSMQHPLPEAMDVLLQKMNEHFQFEEAYMEHIHDPELQEHRAEHEQFRAQFHSLQDRATQGDPTVHLELSSFLFNWFRNHTIREEAGFWKGHRPG